MFWLIEMWKLIGKHVPRDGVALIGEHVVAYWLIYRSTLRCGGSHWVETWRLSWGGDVEAH